jgi:hypothetical protein
VPVSTEVHGPAYPRPSIDRSLQYRDDHADPASIRFSTSPRSGYPDARPQKDGLEALGLAALQAGPPRTPEAELHMRGLPRSDRIRSTGGARSFAR